MVCPRHRYAKVGHMMNTGQATVNWPDPWKYHMDHLEDGVTVTFVRKVDLDR